MNEDAWWNSPWFRRYLVDEPLWRYLSRNDPGSGDLIKQTDADIYRSGLAASSGASNQYSK
jgi:hypothetical protein